MIGNVLRRCAQVGVLVIAGLGSTQGWGQDGSVPDAGEIGFGDGPFAGPGRGEARELEQLTTGLAFAYIRMVNRDGCALTPSKVAVFAPKFAPELGLPSDSFQAEIIKDTIKTAATEADMPLATLGQGADIAVLTGSLGLNNADAQRKIQQLQADFEVLVFSTVQDIGLTSAQVKVELFDSDLRCQETVLHPQQRRHEFTLPIQPQSLRKYARRLAREVEAFVGPDTTSIYIERATDFDNNPLSLRRDSCAGVLRDALTSALKLAERASPDATGHRLTLQIKQGQAGSALVRKVIEQPTQGRITSESVAVAMPPCALESIPRDTDQDGLSDAEEAQLNTDPNSADSDGDGLSDAEEIKLYKTLPMEADSDKGGLADGQEIALGRDPTDNRDDQADPFTLSLFAAERRPSAVSTPMALLGLRWSEKLSFQLRNTSGGPQEVYCLANDASNEAATLGQAPVALQPGGVVHMPQEDSVSVNKQPGLEAYAMFVQCLSHPLPWPQEVRSAWQQSYRPLGQFLSPEETRDLLGILRRQKQAGELTIEVQIR